MPNGILFKVDVVEWVQRTAAGMKASASEDRSEWNAQWHRAYIELAGENATSSGDKGCPRSAAYAVWFLGLLIGSSRPRQCWPTKEVAERLGKNAAYALLALRALEEDDDLSAEQVWKYVQNTFRHETGVEPARSEQGEVRVALALAKASVVYSSRAEDVCSICSAPVRPFFAHYPFIVCRSCDERSVNAVGKTPTFNSFFDSGENPVYIDGHKCWRRYKFGGFVTMLDPDDCPDIFEFYRRHPPRARLEHKRSAAT